MDNLESVHAHLLSTLYGSYFYMFCMYTHQGSWLKSILFVTFHSGVILLMIAMATSLFWNEEVG